MSGDLAKQYDFVIVGSGAGSVVAALIVKAAGLRPLILEKTDKFGGSTAISGGVLWMPNNPVSLRAGVPDTPALAKAYLDACAGPPTPGSTEAKRERFLSEGPKMVDFFERAGMKFAHSEGYSDYHETELPGGMARGRALVAEVFDLRQLDDWVDRLRISPVPPVETQEVSALMLGGRTWHSRFTMLRVGLRMLRNKLGSRLTGMGVSLQGRILAIAKRADLEIWTSAKVVGLIQESRRIVGVRVVREGQETEVRASCGVLINAGGYAHNREFREVRQAQPATGEYSAAPEGDTGEVMQMAVELGGTIDAADLSWWNALSYRPDGQRVFHLQDFGKPHGFLVDSTGSRYVNETTSYVKWGIETFRHHAKVPTLPVWFVVESRNINKYFFAQKPPGKPPKEWIDSGYMKKAATIEELANKIGVDAGNLSRTVERFNHFAETGVDEDFGRGVSAYNRLFGDPNNKPNPTLGKIENPPFYAIQVLAGDVGTGGGLITDEFARVLDADGSPIEGLYATGNSAAPVTGRSYPGPGASIGAAATFGYVSALHALGLNVAPDPEKAF